MTQNQTTQTTEQPKINESEAKALIESALYVSGRPLDLRTLGSVLKVRSKKKVRELAKVLAEEYSKRGGSLELVELDDGRFVLQLKPRYVPYVKRLVIRPLLSTGPLKTLAYIAYRQPVAQAQVVDVRGSQTYEHIKELRNLGLVTTEKLGKTKILRTTEVFADYFNLSHDLRLMKHQLKSLFGSGENLELNMDDKGKIAS
jgi:segregation and condensation protein B